MFKLIKKLLERLEIYNVILFLSFYILKFSSKS